MDRIATLAQRFFETGDDELESYVDAEAIFHSWPFLARGPAGVRQLRGMLAETFADHDVRIEDVIESGDRVVIRATERGRHVGPLMGIEASGKQFSISMIHIFRFERGRIVEHWRESDMLGMLRQLGALTLDIGRPD